MSKKAEKAEKPWAVYYWVLPPMYMGKVIRDSHESLDIKYSEGQQYPAELWDTDYVRTFDSPIKAIAYSLVKNPGKTREEIIEEFLEDFPSQRKVLEPYLPKQFRTAGTPPGEFGKDWLMDDSGKPVRLNFRRSTLEEIEIPHL